jgi:hypothetical protein
MALPSHARQLTLELPVRKDHGQSQAAGSRQFWSDWKVAQKAFRGALAARGPSGRKRPSRADTRSRGQRVVPDAAIGESRRRVANGFNQS